ncbi:PREDICTED: purine-uracil permease NCS1-like [Camelina sativa]|uniref:Purine-uracil permease NCS1-like n=1 Tax=Camelina sativa TaxID=90675 RepID=A0ABM0V7S4_CAMSA|nr:PREDICTED: purine-uracil permease NCS1-like [Camelina sativa]
MVSNCLSLGGLHFNLHPHYHNRHSISYLLSQTKAKLYQHVSTVSSHNTSSGSKFDSQHKSRKLYELGNHNLSSNRRVGNLCSTRSGDIRSRFSAMTGSEFNDLEYDESQFDPSLTNDELKPTTPSQRTFSWLDMSSLWIGLVVGVPTYYLAGSLVDLGMAWWQGIATVVTANLILLVTLVLTAQPGTMYGIAFPVLARSSFGIHGAHIPTLLRALVGCGWYGIETWIGGEAIFLLLPSHIKNSALSHTLPWLGTSPLEFSCFMVFWLAQLCIVWRGMDGIRNLEKYSAPILITLTSCLLVWSYIKAGGFGHMLSLSSKLTSAQFWTLFFPSLTANISFWATLSLNISDFSRFAKSQTDQIIGQAGLPVFMGLFTFVGVAVTSSTSIIFGRVISNPIELLNQIGGLATTILAILGISLATLTTNIAANVVGPANALVNLNPKFFTFGRGAFLTAVIAIVCQPWRLLKSSESFVYTWLIGYSALIGPLGGILLTDYYLIKKMKLNIGDLYSLSPSGDYYYTKGYNVAAIVALVTGIIPVVPGFLHKIGALSKVSNGFVVVYDNALFFSFIIAGFVYWIIMSRLRKKQSSLPSSSQPLL